LGILLIESSSKKIEFGYAEDSGIVLMKVLDTESNADTLTYYIKESFSKQNIKFENIDFVSLSNGPGSFTGLRIGSAIAKGICFATGSKLIEVSTLDIIANKLKSEGKIISLIFSNRRSLEFYFCEYAFESGKLKRISDYKTGPAEIIINGDCLYLINERPDADLPEEIRNKLKDVSEYSNIPSQLELTKEFIADNKYSNFKTSKPFYMKEFVPKI